MSRVWLRVRPRMRVNTGGRIVGHELTLRETPHRFAVDGRQLFTWRALDTLIFPVDHVHRGGAQTQALQCCLPQRRAGRVIRGRAGHRDGRSRGGVSRSEPADLVDVVLRLRIRGDAAVGPHRTRARVVGS